MIWVRWRLVGGGSPSASAKFRHWLLLRKALSWLGEEGQEEDVEDIVVVVKRVGVNSRCIGLFIPLVI